MSDPKDLYAMDPQALRDELDWFRRREPVVRELLDALDDDDSAGIAVWDADKAVQDWEEANPKP